jgi:hypothetical protein
MAETMEPGTTCPACGSANPPTATTCGACGAEMNAARDDGGNGYADSDPALEHVDPENRVELERYDTDTGAEAEIDCGLLRANGIACELGAQTLPGLPSNMILWVNRQDAREARALLDDVEMGLEEGE